MEQSHGGGPRPGGGLRKPGASWPAELRAQREAGAPQNQPPLGARSQRGQAVCLKRDSQQVKQDQQ